MDVFRLSNFSDSCQQCYYCLVLLLIVSEIFEEVSKNDFGFSKTSEAFFKVLLGGLKEKLSLKFVDFLL